VISTDELLSDLTDASAPPSRNVDGPLLIIAGAGSGKTRVITRRVAYLIARASRPARSSRSPSPTRPPAR
jgi:ATP-dependent exoDNAse (exonuclease V) beta subunit